MFSQLTESSLKNKRLQLSLPHCHKLVRWWWQQHEAPCWALIGLLSLLVSGWRHRLRIVISLWLSPYRICQPSKIPLVVCVNECACTCTCTSAHCGCLWLVCHWSKPAGSHHYSSVLDLCPHIKIPLIHPLLSPGEISTRSVLDREQQSSYQLVVVVQDGGSPSRSATGTAFITVLDDNDNDPAFTHSQSSKNLIIQVMPQEQKQAEIEKFLM